MTEVIERIRLVSAEKGADDLLVEAARMALEEARRFGIREAIDLDDSEEVHEACIREFEYARGIGFYWMDVEYHVAVLSDGQHVHLRGIKGRTMTQAKVELEVIVTSKISECPW
jgi:hypothetical protein